MTPRNFIRGRVTSCM